MQSNLSHLMTKPTKWHVHPEKTQISLGIRPVWSVFTVRIKKACVLSYPLSAQQRLIRLHADSEDSDQTGRMPRLIWVFAWRTCHFVGFVMRQLIFVINSRIWETAIPQEEEQLDYPGKSDNFSIFKMSKCLHWSHFCIRNSLDEPENWYKPYHWENLYSELCHQVKQIKRQWSGTDTNKFHILP